MQEEGLTNEGRHCCAVSVSVTKTKHAFLKCILVLVIPYSGKFSQVFNFANSTVCEIISTIPHKLIFTCKSVDGQHAAESTKDALQRDTFK